MKRKNYAPPTLRVVKIRVNEQLLTTSPGAYLDNNNNDNGDQDW